MIELLTSEFSNWDSWFFAVIITLSIVGLGAIIKVAMDEIHNNQTKR